MNRGEIWWAELEDPAGSEPGFRRPVVIVQGGWVLASRISTVTVVPLTSNLRAADAPGHVLLQPRDSSLSKPSVVNVSQVITVDRTALSQRCGKVPPPLMRAIDNGLRLALDL